MALSMGQTLVEHRMVLGPCFLSSIVLAMARILSHMAFYGTVYGIVPGTIWWLFCRTSLCVWSVKTRFLSDTSSSLFGGMSNYWPWEFVF